MCLLAILCKDNLNPYTTCEVDLMTWHWEIQKFLTWELANRCLKFWKRHLTNGVHIPIKRSGMDDHKQTRVEWYFGRQFAPEKEPLWKERGLAITLSHGRYLYLFSRIKTIVVLNWDIFATQPAVWLNDIPWPENSIKTTSFANAGLHGTSPTKVPKIIYQQFFVVSTLLKNDVFPKRDENTQPLHSRKPIEKTRHQRRKPFSLVRGTCVIH